MEVEPELEDLPLLLLLLLLGKLPLKLCELGDFFDDGIDPVEMFGLIPDFELLLELDDDELLLPLFELFLFWMVSLIPSELGLTIYSEFFPCMAAAAEDKWAARAAADDPTEGPVRSVEAHKVGHYFHLVLT